MKLVPFCNYLTYTTLIEYILCIPSELHLKLTKPYCQVQRSKSVKKYSKFGYYRLNLRIVCQLFSTNCS